MPGHLTFNGGHNEVAAILACEIIAGARPAGSRLPTVEEMYERFGVSRVMVREVTKTLTAKGLVSPKTKVGTLVLPPERWNWFDPDFLAWRVRVGLDAEFFNQLTQMRRAVEPRAAALAAEQSSASVIVDLRSALDAMAHSDGSNREFAQADLQFHVTVGAASGNPLFRSFASVVETALAASLSLTAPLSREAVAITVARHRSIVDAIEAGDPDGAAQAMLGVINEGSDRLRDKTTVLLPS